MTSAYSTDSIAPLSLLRTELQENLATVKYEEFPMLDALQKRTAFQTTIDWPANIGVGTVYGRATSTTPSGSNNSDVNEEASLPIGSRVIEHKFSIDLTQATQLLRIGPQALRNMYQTKIAAGVYAMKKEMNAKLYTANGANDTTNHGIVGLNKAINNFVDVADPGADTNIYAGIDGQVYTGWTSFISTNGSNRALSATLMRAVASGMQKKGANYNVVLTTFELVEKYEQLFEANLAINQTSGTFNIGFTGMTFQGRPVIKDADCPANTVYFLNTSDLYLHTYGLQPAITQVGGTISEVVSVDGMNVLLSKMPQSNPHTIDFLMSIQPQLQLFNRRSVGKLEAVN